MLKDLLINEVVPQIIYVVVTTILGIVAYQVKKFLDTNKSFLEAQKEELIQKIGIDKYNQDVAIAKQIILAVEQMGKNFNWEGAVKKLKASEFIMEKTGLSEQDINNIIEATIAEFNKNKNAKGIEAPAVPEVKDITQ
jgi:hypothetical protein